MAQVHRNTDQRNCGASTIVSGQSTVFINGLLCAVEGDECSHGDGQLVSASAGTVIVGGKKLIVVGDHAQPDDVPHVSPQDDPSQGSPNVMAY